jgi:hypothetical protein
MTIHQFYTTVPSNCTITLPPEFRGKPVRVAVENEPVRETGILSIAGILKDCRNENIRDERYEYLMEKYK